MKPMNTENPHKADDHAALDMTTPLPEVTPLHAVATPRLQLFYERRLYRLTREQWRRGRFPYEAKRIAHQRLRAEMKILPARTTARLLMAMQNLE